MTSGPANVAGGRPSPWIYTTRLQKGGALFDDMRQLVRSWRDAPADPQRDDVVRANTLNKGTRARLADVYSRAFLPRFVEGPIPKAWKFVRPLEDVEAPVQIVRPVYYWITAIAEPMIGDFCREVIFPQRSLFGGSLGTGEALNWLNCKGCPWSADVAIRVVRGLLAALRDFGVLEGRARKRLANTTLALRGFAYLAFCFQLLGATNRSLFDHEDWQLYLLTPDDVERLFLLAHQERHWRSWRGVWQ